MKNSVCIVFCLCSVVLACTKENTETDVWRDRLIHARLKGAEWKAFHASPAPRTSCADAEIDNRDKALNLLAVAGGDCLDVALKAVQRYAKDDLAAAYLTRFERNNDPVELLRALETAQGFNRALALEWLGLSKEAILSWNEAGGEKSGWSNEARAHLHRLQQRPDPVRQWNAEEVRKAIRRRDRATLTRIVRAFPTTAAQFFQKYDLTDREGARLYANVLGEMGEHYPEAVLDAIDRPKDRAALKQGLAALHHRQFANAIGLLERAGNPLSLLARYDASVTEPVTAIALQILDPALPHLRPEYRELSSRILIYHANLLEFDDRLLDAYADYDRALVLANGDPTARVAALSRRSQNYTTIGAANTAFGDAAQVVRLLDYVADRNARHQAYASAALSARGLQYPRIALNYQNAAVEDLQHAVINARGTDVADAKHELSVALRERAEIEIELGQQRSAAGDLEQAADLAEAVGNEVDRRLLRMRVRDVQGQILLKSQPAEAAASFGEAIDLAKTQDSTYRAMLHFQRAAARRNARDPHAEVDVATAFGIVRDKVRRALISNPQGASEPLWMPYFSRFRDEYDALIESRLAANDVNGAFVQDELARAFEPMQILLSRSAPPGFRAIESVADLEQTRAAIPEDTVILQFLVRPEQAYTWVVTRERIVAVPQPATKADIERWVADAQALIASRQRDPLKKPMRAAYGQLFRAALQIVPASKTRIVIVPDGPMQGLSFSALEGTREEGYLLEHYSIAVAGSTSIYLYALARDAQLSAQRPPSALLVGDPAFDSTLFRRLPHAREEVQEIARDDYPGAEVLTEAAASVPRFLAGAKRSTIIHFAGHSVPNPQMPWQSRLLLAPDGPQSGELSAEKLMQQLPPLPRTRLVILGACSTAGGSFVGPQGLAPLVRPFIAANVPAVVGALWDVKDASAKELLVSFHCHYRHGDDVAVALRNAQLERLRNNDPAMAWAAFQVVGYAASPYPRSPALEEPSSEHLCTQDSFLGPDGLHSQ